MDIRRPDSGQQAPRIGGLEEGGDVLGPLHAHFFRQERVGFRGIEAERQQVPGRFQELGDGGFVGGQRLPAARPHDEHLIGRELASVVRLYSNTRECEMTLSGRLADIKRLPPRSWLPRRHVPDQAARDRLGGRVAFRTTTDVQLAKHHQALAFAVLHQRGVLEAVTAVEEGQEIPLCRLLDQNRSDIAPAPARHTRGTYISHHFTTGVVWR